MHLDGRPQHGMDSGATNLDRAADVDSDRDCSGDRQHHLYFNPRRQTSRNITKKCPHLGFGACDDYPEEKGRDTNFLATMLEQSRLNRIAAIYTALAILFQAAASSPLIESWIRR